MNILSINELVDKLEDTSKSQDAMMRLACTSEHISNHAFVPFLYFTMVFWQWIIPNTWMFLYSANQNVCIKNCVIHNTLAKRARGTWHVYRQILLLLVLLCPVRFLQSRSPRQVLVAHWKLASMWTAPFIS